MLAAVTNAVQTIAPILARSSHVANVDLELRGKHTALRAQPMADPLRQVSQKLARRGPIGVRHAERDPNTLVRKHAPAAAGGLEMILDLVEHFGDGLDQLAARLGMAQPVEAALQHLLQLDQ